VRRTTFSDCSLPRPDRVSPLRLDIRPRVDALLDEALRTRGMPISGRALNTEANTVNISYYTRGIDARARAAFSPFFSFPRLFPLRSRRFSCLRAGTELLKKSSGRARDSSRSLNFPKRPNARGKRNSRDSFVRNNENLFETGPRGEVEYRRGIDIYPSRISGNVEAQIASAQQVVHSGSLARTRLEAAHRRSSTRLLTHLRRVDRSRPIERQFPRSSRHRRQ